jgi:TonB-dependent starch-binding outer membrane protein SusC
MKKTLNMFSFKKMFIKCFIIILIIGQPGLFPIYDLLGQDSPGKDIKTGIIIKGKVLSENGGTPMIGVNVFLKGTTLGTITDLSGNYSIETSEGNGTLLFSFIGYVTQEIEINSRTEINISLMEDQKELDEVVVIGYGTQKKSDLTGSVAVVSGKDLKKDNSSSLDKALQGKAPGVFVTQTSGRPGSSVSIKIRGIGSITKSTAPLYVIDGMPLGGTNEVDVMDQTPINELNGINPEDIESIQILKDASSTAIYGARGANGVILITTKRGSDNGKVNLTFSEYTKISDFPKNRRYDVMNADEYVGILNTVYDKYNPSKKPAVIGSDSLRKAYGNTNTNWQDELLRTSIGQNYHLGISGGGKSSNFNVSGNYYTEDGIMINTNFNRLNLRTNSDFKLLNDRLKISESVLIGRTNDHGGGSGSSSWVLSTVASPLMPVYEIKNLGGYAGPTDTINGANESSNPVAEQMLSNKDANNTRVLADFKADLQLLKHLTYELNIGTEYSLTRETYWFPQNQLGNIGNRSNPISTLSEGSRSFKRLVIENLLTYQNQIKDHNFVLLAGHTTQNDLSNVFMATGTGFRDTEHNVLSQAENIGDKVGNITEHKIESYLGRFIYDYKSKYLLTASIRRDGSSRFGNLGQRFGNFPSASVGWKLNEDLFPSVKEINMLKLRLGWGQTGNMNIGDYAYNTYLMRADASRYLFGKNETVYLGATDLESTGNPHIQWERASITNIGIDLQSFGNRLQFTTEYYVKNQDKMLVEIVLPILFGKNWDPDQPTNPWVNLGKVENRGFEFNLSFRDNAGPVNYYFGTNLTTIHNKVIALPENTPIYTDYTITMEQHAIGSFYGYVADGIFQNDDEIAAHAKQNAVPGDLRFKDLNFDGKITDADRTIIGKPVPDFIYGISMGFDFYNIDFGVLFNGVQNVDVYNDLRATIGTATDRNAKDFNKLREIMDYWTPENHSTTMTRLNVSDPNENSRISSWFVEDGSFLRLQSVQIGYSLPLSLSNTIKISKLRVYVSGTNLYVFTKYKGYDPEVGSENVLRTGIDQGYYPIPRSVMFGVQLDF